MKAWLFRRPNIMRLIMNMWPPLFFCGIKIEKLSADYRQARVALKWRPWTKNINNSQYGGSLYSMTDPVYATLILGLMGWDRYYVWDKGATIDYVSPGLGKVFFDAEITDELLNDIIEHTKHGEKYTPWIEGNIVDENGVVVASVKRHLYIRMRREFRPKVNEK